MRIKETHIPSIGLFDVKDVYADKNGIMISSYESYKEKSRHDIIFLSDEESRQLFELLQERFK